MPQWIAVVPVEKGEVNLWRYMGELLGKPVFLGDVQVIRAHGERKVTFCLSKGDKLEFGKADDVMHARAIVEAKSK